MDNSENLEKSKIHSATVKTILLAGYSFAGYNIGSGFATGLEGQQFFAVWGFPSAFIAVLISMAATALILTPVYLMGFSKKRDTNYNVYHYYYGEKLGVLLDWYMYFSILQVILTMMSGAGATINQYFGIPKLVGVTGLTTLCIIAALLGIQKLMRILSYSGIIIIAFVLGCVLYIHFYQGISITVSQAAIDEYVTSGAIKKISILGFSNPVLCGVLSAGLLVVSSLPWVASTGALCENKESAIGSGILSAVIYYSAKCIVVYLNLASLDRIAGEEVPILAVFQNFIPALALFYSALIIMSIFSTVSGRLFLFASRFDKRDRKRHIAITILTVVFAAIGGNFLSYSGISKAMFTINGCLGLLLGIVILIRTAFGYRDSGRL